jgi:hypothetical protein
MINIVSYLSLPSSALHPAKLIMLKLFVQYITLPENKTSLRHFKLLVNSERSYLRNVPRRKQKAFCPLSVRNHYKWTSLNNSQSKYPSRTVTATLNKTFRGCFFLYIYKLCDISYLQHSFAQRLEWVWLTFQDANIIALKFHAWQGSYPTDETVRYLHFAWGKNKYNSTFITA